MPLLFLCVLPCLLIDIGWVSSHPCCQQEANAVSQGLAGTTIWPSGGTGLSPVTSGPQHSQREPSRGELLYAWFRVQSWVEDFCHLCKLVAESYITNLKCAIIHLYIFFWLSIDGCSMQQMFWADQIVHTGCLQLFTWTFADSAGNCAMRTVSVNQLREVVGRETKLTKLSLNRLFSSTGGIGWGHNFTLFIIKKYWS